MPGAFLATVNPITLPNALSLTEGRWAREQMRAHGIAVPRSQTKRAKQYVATQIRRDIAGGALTIDPQARRWAK
jgi:hypothetical protein